MRSYCFLGGWLLIVPLGRKPVPGCSAVHQLGQCYVLARMYAWIFGPQKITIRSKAFGKEKRRAVLQLAKEERN